METKNYELFKIRKANRPIDKGLIKRLIESINKIGYIKSRPVIVDEEYHILDGQHRFFACKELSIPIIWEQIYCNGNSDEIVVFLNKNQSIWRLEEYIRFWAAKNIKCYMDLLRFKEVYKLDMSNCISIFFDSSTGYNSKAIRNGDEIKKNPRAEEIAQFICEIKPLHKWAEKVHFTRAIILLFRKANEQQIQKLFDNRFLMFEQPTVETYIKLFENIINRRNRVNILKLL